MWLEIFFIIKQFQMDTATNEFWRKFKLDPSTESIHSFLGYQYRPLTIKEMADFDDDDFGGVEAVACVFFWLKTSKTTSLYTEASW